jgi:anti-anti-sigma factor
MEDPMKVEHHEESGVGVYKVSGALRGQPDCYVFLEDVRTAMTEGATKVIVDLDGVDRLDSAGVGILASIVSSAGNAGSALLFSGISERTERPIKIVGLTQVMQISPTLEEALGRINED